MRLDDLDLQDILDVEIAELSNKKIPIGKISKFTGVSIRSIRHYCELGIITPSYIDKQSSYRYFSLHQITDLLLIKDMRNLNFSLEEIHEIFIDNKKITQVFKIHSSNIRDEIKLLKEKENKLNQLINNFHTYNSNKNIEGNLSPKDLDENLKFRVVNLEDRNFLIFLKQNIYANGLAFKEAFDVLDAKLKELELNNLNVHATFLLEQITDYSKKINMKYAVEFDSNNCNLDLITRKLPENFYINSQKGGHYLSMIYDGEYLNLLESGYKNFANHCKDNHLQTQGDYIEIYHITRPFVKLINNPVTEIQRLISHK